MPYRTLTVEEVADYLHLPAVDIERLVKSGEIPYQNRGGRLVFIRGDLDAWASQRILGLPERRLEDYHQRSTRGTRVFDGDALIPELITPAFINPELASKTRRSVIHDMVAFAESTGRVMDPVEFRESVEAREDLCSTALPGGFALMHCRSHQPYRFDGSFMMLGRTCQDIMYGSPDGRPTRLFFLLCCQDERLHLHTLARMALMAQRTDVLDYLHGASDAQSMYDAMVAAEQAALAGRKRVESPAGDEEN
ncbi:PTS system fructose-specific EIIABC component [mine drainage metagenome]|uniref:PTS system fructose-specific EIIABC component n=1 Tax=mine drainage metagenome TaxID=410659 RepID=A0A1J5SZF2_9ZZZZ